MRRIMALPICLTTGLALAACGSSGGESSARTPGPAIASTTAAGPTGPDMARWLLSEVEGPAGSQVARQAGSQLPATLVSGDPGCDVVNRDTFSASAASVAIAYESHPSFVFTALDFPTSPTPKQVKAALATCHHFNAGDDVEVESVAAPSIDGVDPTNIVVGHLVEKKAGSIINVSVLIEADINGVKYTAQAGAASEDNDLTAALVNKDYLPDALIVLATQREKVKADGQGTHPIKVS
jgi:hypothetical protein